MVAHALVSAPTTEPVTLAEAKSHLRVTDSESDAEIAAKLLAARDYVESYTRRKLMRQTWDFSYDYCWPPRIDIPLQPVASVTSITYVDDSGNAQTLATDQYVLRKTGDQTSIVPAYNVTWPTLRYQPAAFTVRAVVGYGQHAGDVPAPLREAIKLHLELLHDREPSMAGLIESARDACMSLYRVIRL